MAKKNTTKKKKVTIRLTVDQIDKLLLMCDGWGCSQGYLIGGMIQDLYREGLEEGTKQKAGAARRDSK